MSSAHSLTVSDLTKRYVVGGKPTAPAVDGVSFEIEAGEFFTLLGPSGCGKTTTLRSVAGLERPDAGRIAIDGVEVFDAAAAISAPTYHRNIGMVFQSYAIWPHMSVYDNAAFPLKQARSRETSKAQRAKRIERALDVVGLGAFHTRSAAQLSGGQQQRLALARALISEPRLLLLDEPLSNLDAVLRDQMRAELRRVQRDTGVATLYVTHDQAEALSLSDRVAVMDGGKIIQIGTPHEIYHRPASAFVAKFIGRANLLPGVVRRREGEACVVETAWGELECRTLTALPGGGVVVVVRPETVRFAPMETVGSGNVIAGTLADAVFFGEITEHEIDVANGLKLSVRTSAVEERAPHGARVALHLPPSRAFAVATTGAGDASITREEET